MVDGWEVEVTDEIEDDFDLLNPLAGGVVRLVDDDLFYELVYHGGRQFFDSSAQFFLRWKIQFVFGCK